MELNPLTTLGLHLWLQSVGPPHTKPQILFSLLQPRAKLSRHLAHPPVTGASCRWLQAPVPWPDCSFLFSRYFRVAAECHSRLRLRSVRVCAGDTSLSIQRRRHGAGFLPCPTVPTGARCPLSPRAHVCGGRTGSGRPGPHGRSVFNFTDATRLSLLLEFIICLGDSEPFSRHQLL